jgi:hypothetical protein
MAQFKVVRVYVVEADTEADAQVTLKQWIGTLQGRETYDVKLVFESVKPAEEKEGAIKAFARTARDQVFGSTEPTHRAA